ncbi:33611_t:CDS:1, partial [Racocetra persica]
GNIEFFMLIVSPHCTTLLNKSNSMFASIPSTKSFIYGGDLPTSSLFVTLQ